MRDPTAAELLDAWERGLSALPVTRALLLLETAEPDSSLEALAELSVGERDARLLQLRARLFGELLECVARCPACDEPVESTVAINDMLAAHASDAEPRVRWLETDNYRVRYHVPTSADLIAALGASHANGASAALLERCIEDVSGPATWSPERDALPDAVAAAITAGMEAADPLADLEFVMTCPACATGWIAPFDVTAFMWMELDAWARRTFRDVHTLARAYGWSEAEILAQSPARRRVYLDLAGG